MVKLNNRKNIFKSLKVIIFAICIFLLSIILLEASGIKKDNNNAEKQVSNSIYDPQITPMFVFYSMQASAEYFAEITGKLNTIFKQAREEDRQVALFIEEQSNIDFATYNKMIQHKRGYKKYIEKHSKTGYHITQFYYLWNKAQNNYKLNVVKVLPSLNYKHSPGEIDLDTQTINIVQTCERYAKDNPDDYIIFIRSITDRGNLSNLLRHNMGFSPHTFFAHIAYQDFAIPQLYKAEHKQMHDITVLSATALAESSAQQLLQGVEQALKKVVDEIEKTHFWVFILSVLIINFLLIKMRLPKKHQLKFIFTHKIQVYRQFRLIFLILFMLFLGEKHNLNGVLLADAYTPREVWLKDQVSDLLVAHNLGKVYTLYQIASQNSSRRQTFYEKIANSHLRFFKKNLRRYKDKYSSLIKGVLERGKGHELRKKIIILLMGSTDEFVNSTLRLIQRESGFNISAESYKGARGLMQVMPETAKIIKYRLKRRGITNRTYPIGFKNEINENVTLGSEFYSWLNSIFYISTIIRKSDLPLSNLSYGELVKALSYNRIPSKVIDSLVNVIELSPSEKRHVLRMALAGFNAGEQNHKLRKGKLPTNKETALYVKYIDEVYRLWMKDENAGLKALVVLLRAEEEKTFKENLYNARNTLFQYLKQNGLAGDTLLVQLLEQDSSSLFFNDYLLYKNEREKKKSITSSDPISKDSSDRDYELIAQTFSTKG